MTDFYKALKELSKVFGIEESYTDNWGRTFLTRPKIAREILALKGIDLNIDRMALDTQIKVLSISSLPECVNFLMDSDWNSLNLCCGTGKVVMRELRGRAKTVEWDMDNPLVCLCLDEETGLTSISVPTPGINESGLFRFKVTLEINNTETSSVELALLVCPDSAYLPETITDRQRIAGVGVAVYGLRSSRNWGIGDFTDLLNYVDWARSELGAQIVGINPLHAIFNKSPFNSSPYMPSSRLYRNDVYLDVTNVCGYRSSEKAQRFVNSIETQALLKRLRKEEHVNYEEVSRIKTRVLRMVFESFCSENRDRPEKSRHWEDFQTYISGEGIFLERYATFCALRDWLGGQDSRFHSWREWPAGYQNPESDEVKHFVQTYSDEISFWMFIQWQIDSQLRQVQNHAREIGMTIGLYHDQALAVDSNGADFWAWREYFTEGFSVGAPPDSFAPEGQDWGFCPPNSWRIRESFYTPLRKILRANMKYGGALRIDHVMQLHHLFWIPRGGSPSEGTYVKDYEADLMSVLALESQTAKNVVIGEDLGTVPHNFRERLIQKGLLSYRLFYFERDSWGNLLPYYQYPERALVSLSTHDLPTLAGFWAGLDIEKRVEIGRIKPENEMEFRQERTSHKAKIIERLVSDGVLPAETAHQAWIQTFPTDDLHSATLSFVFRTPSAIALINQEDLFLDTRQQNLPGTTWENPNWVTKNRFSIEELTQNTFAAQMAAKFKKLVISSGRQT